MENESRSRLKRSGRSVAKKGKGGGADDDSFGGLGDMHQGNASHRYAEPSPTRRGAGQRALESKPELSKEEREREARFALLREEVDGEDDF